MKYAKEVIELMVAYPGRFFKRSSIKRYVSTKVGCNDRAIEEGVSRVLAELIDAGSVRRLPDQVSRGKGYMYQWKTDT